MSGLIDKVVVVTGASSGIGKAIAKALVREKSVVCGVIRSLDRLQEPAILPADRLSWFTADLENEGAIRDVIHDVKQKFGGIDILVSNAGVISLGDIADASVENLDRLYRVNVRAAYLLAQGFLPTVSKRSGQVVFINSSAGFTAKAGLAQYAATKYALKAIADSLRGEVNRNGVRVLSIYPGRTASPMQEMLHALENIPYRPQDLIQPADVASVVIETLKLPRTVEVTDIHMRPLTSS